MVNKDSTTMDKPQKTKYLVETMIDDLEKTCVIEEAMELLNDGYPLDEHIKCKLREVGIDPTRFIDIHEDKIG